MCVYVIISRWFNRREKESKEKKKQITSVRICQYEHLQLRTWRIVMHWGKRWERTRCSSRQREANSRSRSPWSSRSSAHEITSRLYNSVREKKRGRKKEMKGKSKDKRKENKIESLNKMQLNPKKSDLKSKIWGRLLKIA